MEGAKRLSLCRVWCLGEVVEKGQLSKVAVGICSKLGWSSKLDCRLECIRLSQCIRGPRENGQNLLSILGAVNLLDRSFVGICGVGKDAGVGGVEQPKEAGLILIRPM